MAHGDFKNLTRRTASNKLLSDKAFNIAKNPKYDGHQRGLASLVYKFFDEKTSAKRANKFPVSGVKNGNFLKNELAEELHKLIIRNVRKRKVHSPFIDNIWGVDLADMQLISHFNKEFGSLLCVIDIFSK